MPRAYTVQGIGTEVCQLLTQSPRPLKAKEIARMLDESPARPLNKRSINSVLYELRRYGIASRDDDFRWAICPSAVMREGALTKFVPTVDPEKEKRTRELGPRPLSSPVGHWIMTLGREPATGREVWRMECALCGFQTGFRVQNHQQVFPLTGNMRDRRRRHDRTAHPEKARDQIRAEKLLLGEKV
jgi:hypothetical protein